MTTQTGAAMEFVSDDRDIRSPRPELRTVTDPAAAAQLIRAETLDRLDAVLGAMPDPPVLLLSGGVDSILVAAACAHLGVKPYAITVIAPTGTDADNATATAAALGLEHAVVTLDNAAVTALAADGIARLGIPELWEVTYAVPMLATIPTLDKLGARGPILTGSGADAIIAGGKQLSHPLESAEATAELDQIVRTESSSNFRYDRLVPDFYPRVMGSYSDQIVHVFQTGRFWDIAETFAPGALFGERDGEIVDKLALRMACDGLLPEHARGLAWARKSPIQRSAGIMAALAESARGYAADMPGAQTYGDPTTESWETVATRLFLALLQNGSQS